MNTRKTTSWVMRLAVGALVSEALALGGCAGAQRPGRATELPYRTTDEIDEQPARLEGQDADLTVRDGVLVGRLDGGNYNVKIMRDAAVGSGPMGPIDVRLVRQKDGYDVAGVWNGGHIHVVVGDSGVHGRVLKQISGEERGYESCRYDIEKEERAGSYEGISECLGGEPLEYQLQVHGNPGELTEEENVVLLVAYFAAPPPVRSL